MAEVVLIDGSFGEGGGQIIRTSLSLAALTGRPLQIVNIRARRSRPGLQAQHLTAVRAAGALCGAELTGDQVGSASLFFRPTASVRANQYRFNIGTAGAAPLVAQTVLVPLTFAGDASRVTITGGTHVPHAPVEEYLEAVYLPALLKLGLEARLTSPRHGFFPKGGGELEIDLGAAPPMRPLLWTDRGRLQSLRGFLVTCGLPEHVAERGAKTLESGLKGFLRGVKIEHREKPGLSPGAAVVIAAECASGMAGFSALGERGRPIEQVAEEACKAFRKWWASGQACDEHLADQLVLPLALVNGESRWTTPVVTEHLRTVLWVAQQFLPVEAAVTERVGGGEVVLRGAGSR